MAALNFVRKLPPTPLLLPGAALVLATLLLLATLLVQGRALRESARTLAPPLPSAAASKDSPLPAASTTTNLAMLANSQLFGHYDPARAAAESTAQAAPKPKAELADQAPDALPEASLALKLQGIVYKKDPAQRRAIIAGDGPNPEARKIGETLLGDAVIRYIEARRVVVEQQGQLKALSLLDPALGAEGAPVANSGPVGVAMPGNVPAPYATQPPQAMRRGAFNTTPPQAYVPPPAPEEVPPDTAEGSAPDEEAPPPDDGGDAGNTNQPEPTE